MGLAIGLAAGLIALVISHQKLFVTAEAKLYDERMQWAARSGAPRGDIALVEINEASLRDFDPVLGRWPWPRITHAALIDFIAQGRPKVIAYDLLLGEPDTRLSFQYGEHVMSGDDSDGALGRAIQDAGNVILLADATYEGVTGTLAQEPRPFPDPGYPRSDLAEPRELITPPLDAYTAAAKALGHNRLALDADGIARKVSPFVRSGDRMLPSFGIAAAVEAAGLDKTSFPIAAEHHIRFEAPPLDAAGRRGYPSYEARHLILAAEELAAGETPSLDPSVFRDRIVFVGVTAKGIGDIFPSPFGQAELPGILLHASVADNVLSGRAITRVPRWGNTIVLFVPVLLVGAAAARLPVFPGTAVSLAIMAALTLYLDLWEQCSHLPSPHAGLELSALSYDFQCGVNARIELGPAIGRTPGPELH